MNTIERIESCFDSCGITHTGFNSDTKLSDICMDSLDSVEVLMSIEEEFDCEISDEEAEKFVYVSDIEEHLERYFL